MSGDDNFIARWSRLKQQAAEEKKKPRAGTETEDQRTSDADAGSSAQTKGRLGHAPGKPVESAPPFDPASLPPIESIVADTDIRAFLQKGVPATLTKSALRQAWRTDPAIRDFVEVAENQWDFTNPASIPGFGSLQASDNMRHLVEQALGNLPQTPDASTPPAVPGASQEIAGSAANAKAAGEAPSTEASLMHKQVAAVQEGSHNPDTAGVAALQHSDHASEVGTVPRRKGHGRAMPR
jgi:uncharacterized protein DUF3306